MKLLVISIFSLFILENSYAWNKVLQEDQITVYTKKVSGALMPFKASGVIPSNIEKVLDVLKNLKEKKDWSPKLKSVKLHQRVDNETYIFSEFYKTPWPATDREFLLKGSIKKSQDKYFLNAKSFNDKSLMNADHIQADVKTLDLVLEKIDEKNTRVTFEFHGDFKGWMPTWLMNLIQKKWPLRFIQSLRKRVGQHKTTLLASKNRLPVK